MKILGIKQREAKPFLTIFPNIELLKIHTSFNQKLLEEFTLLGPFSFIVNYTSENFLAKQFISKEQKIGVRFPKCKFAKAISLSNISFISTS